LSGYPLLQIEPLLLQLQLESDDFEGVAEKASAALRTFLAESQVAEIEFHCLDKKERKAGKKLRRVERKY